METVHLDFETCSDLDLKKVGAFAYAEHPSTRILCMSWQREAEREPSIWYPNQTLPVELLRNAGSISAWNVTFERVIWERIAVPKHGFPPRDPDTWVDPQARAKASNRPGSLDGAAAAVGSTQVKDKDGKRLMQKMAKGKDLTPENLWRLGQYCQQDVRTEIETASRLRELPTRERDVLRASEIINHNGVKIDLEFAQLAAKAAADYQHHVGAEMEKRYGFGPRQVAEIGAFCARHRVVLPDLRADTVEAVLLLGELLPDPVVDVLKMRQKAAAAAPGKYAAMLRAVNNDGRLRGMFSYCGAGQTGRWSGRIVQLHNLARPTMEMDFALAWMEILREANDWRALGDDPLDVLLNCLRPTLIPGDADVFTAGDESAIEARVLPWLAGCVKPLMVFSQPGGDIYLHAAKSIYHREITKADKAERQIGKVATLALGFGGGKNAFATMARGYGVKVPEDEADQIKRAWRDAHPEIVTLWAVLDSMALRTVLSAGTPEARALIPQACTPSEKIEALGYWSHVHANLRDLGIEFYVYRGDLYCLLPSGRSICYPNPRVSNRRQDALYNKLIEAGVEPEMAEWQCTRWRVEFDQPAGDSMIRSGTYGGKLSENLTQAVARDVLAEAMLKFGPEQIVMHVHDELVAEGDHKERMEEALTDPPSWSKRGIMHLPLAAEVNLLERYWK